MKVKVYAVKHPHNRNNIILPQTATVQEVYLKRDTKPVKTVELKTTEGTVVTLSLDKVITKNVKQ